nr:PilN domain-containing protein [uncultured Rhodoferax sp.]
MPQQINLCTPLLLAPKRYFSAQTMVQALTIFVVVGGVLCGAWVWNLNRAATGLQQLMQTQAKELTDLKAALQAHAVSAAPLSPELQTQVQDVRAQVQAQQKVLLALQDGRMRSGSAHSDRLVLVSRSIPGQVWVTGVEADATRFEVAGYTLEPSALNEWVNRLSFSPLMQGLRLATVKVQSARLLPVAAGTAPAGREVWSFTLVSAQPTAKAAPAKGSTP